MIDEDEGEGKCTFAYTWILRSTLSLSLLELSCLL